MKTIHQLLLTTVKNAGLGIGGIAILCVVITLAAPKAAHAVVATLVQVANTAANPVPNLDTERNARVPYISSVSKTCANVGACQFDMTAAPAGYRLVAEHASALLTMPNGTTTAPVGGLGWVGGNFQIGLGGTAGFSFAAAATGTVSQAVKTYFDAGETPFIDVYAPVIENQNQYATLTGYLENCSITGCPAIQ